MKTCFAVARKLMALTLCASATVPLLAEPLKLVTSMDPSRTPAASAGGDSGGAVMSPDGRFVLFASSARNLVALGTNGPIPGIIPAPVNVFLRDRSSGTTTLVSANLSGTGGGNASSFPTAISTNGHYALFESSASDLVPGDTNNAADIFLRDLVSGTTVVVSIGTNNLPANGASRSSVMTPDGRYVAFVSEANNLVPADTNRIADVLVRDLQTGTTILVSAGAQTNALGRATLDSSESPVMTPDGRYVAFYSTATNLVAGVPAVSGTRILGDIYVRDLVTGTTVWASVDARPAVESAMGQTNVYSFNHAISDDGQVVVYEANPAPTGSGLILRYQLPTGLTERIYTNAAVLGGNLPELSSLDMTGDGRFVAFVANLSGTSGSNTCILVWDAQTGLTQLASGNLANTIQERAICSNPVIDPSGRLVLFLSNAAGLVTNNLSGDFHLYARDLPAATTTLVDVDPDGLGVGVNPLAVPQMSADGRLVVFEAPDGRLVPNDSNEAYDVFVRDLVQRTNELISVRHADFPCVAADGVSSIYASPMSADGGLIAFASEAVNLVSNDANGFRDVFVRDVLAGTNRLVSVSTNGVVANAFSGEPAISGDGRYVLFTSMANDLVVGDTNNAQDIFLRDLQAGTTVLVSVNTNGTGPGDQGSFSPVLSGNGRFALFQSTSVNLAPGGSSSVWNKLFLRDLQLGKTYGLITNGYFGLVSMTPDGRFVAFRTGNGTTSYIYVWDSQAGASVFSNAVSVSVLAMSPNGSRLAYATNTYLFGGVWTIDRATGTNWAIAPHRVALHSASRGGFRFSSDGRFLAYAGAPSSTNRSQIYLYDFQTGTNLLVSQAYDSGAPADGNSDRPEVSPDGRFVAYRSEAANLVPGDKNGVQDIFLFDRLSGSTTLLTTSLFGHRSADNRSLSPFFSADGQTLLFQSWASDLALGDGNTSSDLFALTLFSSSPIPVFSAQMLPPTPGQNCTLTWPVLPGKSYRVQFKDSLEDADWQDLKSGVSVMGNQGYLSDAASSPGQRFYRIVAF